MKTPRPFREARAAAFSLSEGKEAPGSRTRAIPSLRVDIEKPSSALPSRRIPKSFSTRTLFVSTEQANPLFTARRRHSPDRLYFFSTGCQPSQMVLKNTLPFFFFKSSFCRSAAAFIFTSTKVPGLRVSPALRNIYLV